MAQVRIENDNVVIEIPVDEIVETQLNNYFQSLRIKDRQKMIAWLQENLVTCLDDDRSETFFKYFLDLVFCEAYGSQAWLEGNL